MAQSACAETELKASAVRTVRQKKKKSRRALKKFKLSHPPNPCAPRCSFIQTRPLAFSPSLFKGVAEAALYCAHRTSTFLSCAFCEQEGHLAAPDPFSASCYIFIASVTS